MGGRHSQGQSGLGSPKRFDKRVAAGLVGLVLRPLVLLLRQFGLGRLLLALLTLVLLVMLLLGLLLLMLLTLPWPEWCGHGWR